MKIKLERCLECGSYRMVVFDEDTGGFGYSLYRHCLDCQSDADIRLSEVA